MPIAQSQRVLNAAEVAALDAQHVARMLVAKDTTIDQLKQQNQTLQHQLEWFRRQLFGSKSVTGNDAAFLFVDRQDGRRTGVQRLMTMPSEAQRSAGSARRRRRCSPRDSAWRATSASRLRC